MRSPRSIVCAVLFCCASLLGFGQTALPQQPVSREELQTLRDALAAQQKQIDALKAELSALKAQQVGTTAVSTATPAPEPLPPAVQQAQFAEKSVKPDAGWEGGHFYIQTADGEFQMQPSGYLQLDYRAYSGETAAVNTFVLRRARLGAQGRMGRNVEFKLEGDFVDGKTALREASLNIASSRPLQFKFGQFKEPFSQELLTNDSDLVFVERSLAANILMGGSPFTPGFAVHGDLIGGALQYSMGAFNGRGSLGASDSSTPEAAFRLRVSPWRSTESNWLKGLSVGGALTRGRTHDSASFAGTMPTGSFTFFAPERVNGDVLRTNAELTWIKGPAAVRAEFSQGRQERRFLGPDATDLPGVSAKAVYVTGTYLLTGERQPDVGEAAPLRPAFGKGAAGIGAWQLKFRYSGQHMKDSFLNTRADEFSTGVNWYITSSVSYLLDINLERLRTPVTTPVPLLPQNFVTILSRMQLRF